MFTFIHYIRQIISRARVASAKEFSNRTRIARDVYRAPGGYKITVRAVTLGRHVPSRTFLAIINAKWFNNIIMKYNIAHDYRFGDNDIIVTRTRGCALPHVLKRYFCVYSYTVVIRVMCRYNNMRTICDCDKRWFYVRDFRLKTKRFAFVPAAVIYDLTS